MRGALGALNGDARVAVLKAVVTQASSAIPVVPLYASILFRVMKDMQVHEDCIQHIHRLMREHMFSSVPPKLDAVGRLRVDDWELRDDVQSEVKRRFATVDTDNLMQLSDLAGFRRDFLRIFGFEAEGVDYEADISPL
jgi:enoyl-[acyl-carrier protein] reductase/trans-2-enoyl-CoA reductase (NAD+)